MRLDGDVFRCPKCDAGGGAIAFYGFMVKGIDPAIVKGDKELYKEYLKEIKEKLAILICINMNVNKLTKKSQ